MTHATPACALCGNPDFANIGIVRIEGGKMVQRYGAQQFRPNLTRTELAKLVASPAGTDGARHSVPPARGLPQAAEQATCAGLERSGNAMSEPLTLYTIYERPRDYPDHFVLREHHVTGDGNCPSLVACIGPSLEAVRKFVPDGTVNLGRMPQDEPQIVETWV
jgi:hypothetical protein